MSFFNPPALQAIEVPVSAELLSDGIEVIAYIRLQAPDDRPRFPQETERFYVLEHIIAANAETFGLGPLFYDSQRKWLGCAQNILQIPAQRCWGTVEIGRVGPLVNVAVFNRHYLTPTAVARLKRMFRKIQIQLGLSGIQSAKKVYGESTDCIGVNPNGYTVVQNSTAGELPAGIPRVLACLEGATKRVRVFGLIYPEEPRVVRYPLTFSINADSSAVVTNMLKKNPGTVFTADDLQCELVRTDVKNVRATLRSIAARSPLLVPRTRHKRPGYLLRCSEVEAYAVVHLGTNPLALLVYAPIRQ